MRFKSLRLRFVGNSYEQVVYKRFVQISQLKNFFYSRREVFDGDFYVCTSYFTQIVNLSIHHLINQWREIFSRSKLLKIVQRALEGPMVQWTLESQGTCVVLFPHLVHNLHLKDSETNFPGAKASFCSQFKLFSHGRGEQITPGSVQYVNAEVSIAWEFPIFSFPAIFDFRKTSKINAQLLQ